MPNARRRQRKKSNQPNAIPKDTLRYRKKVDPVTGKKTNNPNVITINYGQYHMRELLDPATGLKSNDPTKAISRSRYRRGEMVDPDTGEKSDKPNAIPRRLYYRLQIMVDPDTGKKSKKSDKPDAIPRRLLQVDPFTGRKSNNSNAIPCSLFYSQRQARLKGNSVNTTAPIQPVLSEITDNNNNQKDATVTIIEEQNYVTIATIEELNDPTQSLVEYRGQNNTDNQFNQDNDVAPQSIDSFALLFNGKNNRPQNQGPTQAVYSNNNTTAMPVQQQLADNINSNGRAETKKKNRFDRNKMFNEKYKNQQALSSKLTEIPKVNRFDANKTFNNTYKNQQATSSNSPFLKKPR